VSLVASAAGTPENNFSYTGNEIQQWGLHRLGNVLKQNLSASVLRRDFGRSAVVAQFSSFGNVSAKWVEQQFVPQVLHIWISLRSPCCAFLT